jgi:hypothetical protein
MLHKKILIISTSIAFAMTVASQSNADVKIIHNTDDVTNLQAGKVKISINSYGATQVETGRIRLSTDNSVLASRRYKPRRYGKPFPVVKPPNVKIPAIPVVKSPNLKIPAIPVVKSPNLKIPGTTAGTSTTVIQRSETYTNAGGSVQTNRTTTRSSNGSSSNSQSNVIRGDGQSHTNSNHDSDD